MLTVEKNSICVCTCVWGGVGGIICVCACACAYMRLHDCDLKMIPTYVRYLIGGLVKGEEIVDVKDIYPPLVRADGVDRGHIIRHRAGREEPKEGSQKQSHNSDGRR